MTSAAARAASTADGETRVVVVVAGVDASRDAGDLEFDLFFPGVVSSFTASRGDTRTAASVAAAIAAALDAAARSLRRGASAAPYISPLHSGREPTRGSN